MSKLLLHENWENEVGKKNCLKANNSSVKSVVNKGNLVIILNNSKLINLGGLWIS